jgi:hypothetical protein
MPIKIYEEDNYVLIDDGHDVFEYAKGYTLYTLKRGIYTIRETQGGEYNITQAQLTAGNIVNKASVAYTESTFVTFLRQNTGFKTAAGGSAATPIGALLTKTGQTTSFRTGDDGDIEAGRATSFTVLSGNNPFGNTNRFTSTAGTQTYSNNIVIDWSTYDGTNVLGYYRVVPASDVTWNSAIDSAAALSTGGFTSGWRLPNIHEMLSICNYQLTQLLNYAPFSITNTLWISTTYAASNTLAYTLSGSWINLSGKSGAGGRWIAVRTFTVNGTTLS